MVTISASLGRGWGGTVGPENGQGGRHTLHPFVPFEVSYAGNIY